MKINVNPDKKYAEEVRKKIKDNGGYCPCQIGKTQDTKCICRSFREQESGYCHCGLYFK